MPFASDFEIAPRGENKFEAKMIQNLGYARVLKIMCHPGFLKREQYSDQKFRRNLALEFLAISKSYTYAII